MVWSKSRTDKLGDRLRRSESPSDDDLAEYEEMVIERYSESLQVVIERVQEAGFDLTTRFPKTAGTLIEKLKRDRTRLSTIQDVAGARTICEHRPDQDEVVAKIMESLAGVAECTKKDRRDDPSFGYRAVHIVADLSGVPVEIQVRTRLQDQWANTMEKFADIYGRQVRYGLPPDDPDRRVHPDDEITRGQLANGLLELADLIDRVETAETMMLQITDIDLDHFDESHFEVFGINNEKLDDESLKAAIIQGVQDDLDQAKEGLSTTLQTLDRTLGSIENPS